MTNHLSFLEQYARKFIVRNISEVSRFKPGACWMRSANATSVLCCSPPLLLPSSIRSTATIFLGKMSSRNSFFCFRRTLRHRVLPSHRFLLDQLCRRRLQRRSQRPLQRRRFRRRRDVRRRRRNARSGVLLDRLQGEDFLVQGSRDPRQMHGCCGKVSLDGQVISWPGY